MKLGERALSAVPRATVALLAVAVALQLGWRLLAPMRAALAQDLPPAPAPEILRLASLGEREALARIAMLWLQAFDAGGANRLAYRDFDYQRLAGWLEAILRLDPRSRYPLFAAARIYAENPDEGKVRTMLEFVYREFHADPATRWPWLAHAALLAKHRLRDLALALRYAQAVEAHARGPQLPLWARQMQIFILEDMGELEAAKVMLGGLIASGEIADPFERRFLLERLEAMERRARPRR